MPRAWGSQGRLNVVGHWVRDGERWGLFCHLVLGPMWSGEVRAYLQGVVERLESPMKVFLDNAAFHRGKGIREALEGWARRGLSVGYLPRYSPHGNPMEGVWRRVKGFLMPRRHYESLEELKEAVVQALRALGGVELKILELFWGERV